MPINNKSPIRKKGISYTINDIASHTGLSRSTVSRVINRSNNVSDNAREKVLLAIDEMSYVPNLIARGLRTESRIIGVVMQDILNPYYIEALYEIEKLCKASGYALLHMNSDCDPHIESDNLYQLLSMKVQGIILLGNMLDETDRMINLAMKDTQLITMEGRIKGVDCVVSNPSESIKEMVCNLIELGHRNFGLVHHNMRSYPIHQREKVFLSSLNENGYSVPNKNFFYGDNYIEQLDQAYEQNRLPTALFALNDNTAFNLYRWCRLHSIDIPTQLSVVGFDNVKTYEMMMPSLTTIHQPIGQLAEIATRTLIERIEHAKDPNYIKEVRELVIDTKFILRESIGPVK